MAHGTLPDTARYIIDVGPSYVVVSAIALAVLCGGWLARGAALADFALLVFAGDIFGGLSRLDVAAVGHLTALVTGAVAGGLAVWLRRFSDRQAGPSGAGTTAMQHGRPGRREAEPR